MHPSILDDFGLEEALLADCTNLMRRTDIEVDCQIENVPSQIPKPIELCLYRVAQESLWNAVKHSGASRISVRLAGKNRQLLLEVSDNGCGIDSAGDPPSKGLGLASIKERIRLVSGTVEIQSQPEKGTSITASVPLKEFNS
jgi:signal transduction histidine kinase